MVFGKRWLFFIGNGAEIRKGRKSPGYERKTPFDLSHFIDSLMLLITLELFHYA